MDTTQSPEDKVTASMEELGLLVEDFTRRGKQANAAALKPALQFRSFGVFSEAALGFPSFRSFLRAAEDRGFIRLRQTAGGDLNVLPADRGTSTVGEPAMSKAEPKPATPIRQELW